MMLAVLFVVLMLLLLATHVHKLIGDSGTSIISRIMGLILSSDAVIILLVTVIRCRLALRCN